MKSITIALARCARAAGFAALAAAATAVPFSAANAGFFDFLFQPLHPPAAPEPSYSAPHPVFHARKKAAALHRPQSIVAKLHAAHEGRTVRLAQRPLVTGYIDDDSLRNGDAVMTAEGLRIFTGSSGAHHSEDDFAPISEIKGLSKSQYSALLAVDVGTSGALADPVLLNGRSVADGGAAAGEMIVDPKGNKIRYVGP